MRIAIVGAAGRTGRAAVRVALDRGHELIGLGRHAPAEFGGGEWRSCDVTDASQVTEALSGAEAVINCVGIGSSREETTLYSQGTANLLAAVQSQGAERLVVLSAAPVGPRSDHGSVEHRIVLPILELFFGATYRDMRRMEGELVASTVSWTALRAPRLVDRPARGVYRLDHLPPRGGRQITIGDLAAALVDCAESRTPEGAAYVAN